MKIKVLAVLAIGLAFFMTTSVFAAPKISNTITSAGVDISYPQCGLKVPTDFAFGVVGVNGGLATNPNPCLASQLSWATRASGITSQEPVQLYVNTANPGGLQTSSWPQDNINSDGYFVINPYGLCDGSDSLACAWMYGWSRAHDDVQQWFIPAAQVAAIDTNPKSYIWWLDVETENTWKMSKSFFAHASNTAVLEGMTNYLQSNEIRVGLYSTAYQWGEIVGNNLNDSSNLNGLINWRPGGASLATAKQACSATPLTDGGKVVMTQYIVKAVDYNLSCTR